MFCSKNGNKTAGVGSEKGVTLFELMVAMVLLVMVSVMIYSVLNVGINFANKGETRIAEIGRERALLEILHRQVHGARYDRKQKKQLIEGDDNYLKLVTNCSLFDPDSGVILAIYLFDPNDRILYYTEKKDFYNPEYEEDYLPARDEMTPIMTDVPDFGMSYDRDSGVLTVVFLGNEYQFFPRCWEPEEEES